MSYYKVINPSVLKAHDQFMVESNAVQLAGEAFAKRFPNSKAVFHFDVHGRRFHGLVFEPAMNSPLWTKPMASSGNVQHPRLSPPKGVKGQERLDMLATMAQLSEEWVAHFPKEKADREPVWTSLGIDWGDVMMNGMQWFVHDGAFYCNTSIRPRDGWSEILGSEYDAASAARKAGALQRKEAA